MSHMKKSCDHLSCWLSWYLITTFLDYFHVSLMNESCHTTYEWGMSHHIWMRHVTPHMNESCHTTYEWVLSHHIWMKHVTPHMNEACHTTYEWGMWHISDMLSPVLLIHLSYATTSLVHYVRCREREQERDRRQGEEETRHHLVLWLAWRRFVSFPCVLLRDKSHGIVSTSHTVLSRQVTRYCLDKSQGES